MRSKDRAGGFAPSRPESYARGMASTAPPSVPPERRQRQRARLQVESARVALAKAWAGLPAGDPARQDLEEALLATRVILDTLLGLET